MKGTPMQSPLTVVIGTGGALGLLLVILVVLAIIYFAKRV